MGIGNLMKDRRKSQKDGPVIDKVIIPKEKQKSFLIGCSLCLFKACTHLFSVAERNEIEGNLRRGNLDIASSPIVADKLLAAKNDGVMSIEDFSCLYQFSSFCKKTPEKGSEDICREAGLKKLQAGEASCLVTNMTINSRIQNRFSLFDRVKRIIQDIIGEVPSNLFTKSDITFGPGSTVNLNRRSYEQTSLFYKQTDRLIVPERAKYYLAALVSSHPNWVDNLGTHYHLTQAADERRLDFEMRVFEAHFEIVPDDYPSRIGFVAKDKNEHRAIGIELNGLIPLQKLVGDFFRRKLISVGVDLNTQDRNRHLARLAKTFGLSTIDLKNASSSISLELVRAILPADWFCVLEAFRSSHGYCDGLEHPIEYQMISSMGNGFTFELESLIFFALAKATCEENGISPLEIRKSVTVFGDDIIIPQTVARSFIQNLTLFGFTANLEKSFIKGFFFESCGADYYNSVEVRPFFLKREVSTVRDIFFLLNSILYNMVKGRRTYLGGLYLFIFKKIREVNCYGPLHFEQSKRTGRMKIDDMESVLRVPLEFAQAHGGVKFDPSLFAWTYKRWIRISVQDPLGQNSQYAVQHARYQTFLQGTLDGRVLLRGRMKTRQQRTVSSSWDGILCVNDLRYIKNLFYLVEQTYKSNHGQTLHPIRP